MKEQSHSSFYKPSSNTFLIILIWTQVLDLLLATLINLPKLIHMTTRSSSDWAVIAICNTMYNKPMTMLILILLTTAALSLLCKKLPKTPEISLRSNKFGASISIGLFWGIIALGTPLFWAALGKKTLYKFLFGSIHNYNFSTPLFTAMLIIPITFWILKKLLPHHKDTGLYRISILLSGILFGIPGMTYTWLLCSRGLAASLLAITIHSLFIIIRCI